MAWSAWQNDREWEVMMPLGSGTVRHSVAEVLMPNTWPDEWMPSRAELDEGANYTAWDAARNGHNSTVFDFDAIDSGMGKRTSWETHGEGLIPNGGRYNAQHGQYIWVSQVDENTTEPDPYPPPFDAMVEANGWVYGQQYGQHPDTAAYVEYEPGIGVVVPGGSLGWNLAGPKPSPAWNTDASGYWASQWEQLPPATVRAELYAYPGGSGEVPGVPARWFTPDDLVVMNKIAEATHTSSFSVTEETSGVTVKSDMSTGDLSQYLDPDGIITLLLTNQYFFSTPPNGARRPDTSELLLASREYRWRLTLTQMTVNLRLRFPRWRYWIPDPALIVDPAGERVHYIGSRD